jgi:hypothetical protein
MGTVARRLLPGRRTWANMGEYFRVVISPLEHLDIADDDYCRDHFEVGLHFSTLLGLIVTANFCPL